MFLKKKEKTAKNTIIKIRISCMGMGQAPGPLPRYTHGWLYVYWRLRRVQAVGAASDPGEYTGRHGWRRRQGRPRRTGEWTAASLRDRRHHRTSPVRRRLTVNVERKQQRDDDVETCHRCHQTVHLRGRMLSLALDLSCLSGQNCGPWSWPWPWSSSHGLRPTDNAIFNPTIMSAGGPFQSPPPISGTVSLHISTVAHGFPAAS